METKIQKAEPAYDDMDNDELSNSDCVMDTNMIQVSTIKLQHSLDIQTNIDSIVFCDRYNIQTSNALQIVRLLVVFSAASWIRFWRTETR
jgi:hypothetical protein